MKNSFCSEKKHFLCYRKKLIALLTSDKNTHEGFQIRLFVDGAVVVCWKIPFTSSDCLQFLIALKQNHSSKKKMSQAKKISSTNQENAALNLDSELQVLLNCLY